MIPYTPDLTIGISTTEIHICLITIVDIKYISTMYMIIKSFIQILNVLIL